MGAYGARMRAAGAAFTTVCCDGITHDFMMLNPLSATDATRAAVARAISILRGAPHGGDLGRRPAPHPAGARRWMGLFFYRFLLRRRREERDGDQKNPSIEHDVVWGLRPAASTRCKGFGTRVSLVSGEVISGIIKDSKDIIYPALRTALRPRTRTRSTLSC